MLKKTYTVDIGKVYSNASHRWMNCNGTNFPTAPNNEHNTVHTIPIFAGKNGL